MSVDKFLDRQKRKGYDCLNFAYEVWADLTGKDLSGVLDGFLSEASKERATGAPLRVRHLRRFRVLSSPCSPCLVLMQRPGQVPHLGVFIRGRVLHLLSAGVEFQPVEIAARGFKSYRFITC